MEVRDDNIRRRDSGNTKKTPRTKKLIIYDDDLLIQRESPNPEISNLKNKLKETESRAEEWKKKYKSQAETFRENFENFKSIKLENDKLRGQVTELKKNENSSERVVIRTRKVMDDETMNKYHSTIVENKKLFGQLEQMQGLVKEMNDFEESQGKWNETLSDNAKKLSQALDLSQKGMKECISKISQLEAMNNDLEGLVEQFKEKDMIQQEQIQLLCDQVRTQSFQGDNLVQQNRNLLARNEMLNNNVQEFEHKAAEASRAAMLKSNEISFLQACIKDKEQLLENRVEDENRAQIRLFVDHVMMNVVEKSHKKELSEKKSVISRLEDQIADRNTEIMDLNEQIVTLGCKIDEFGLLIDLKKQESQMAREGQARAESNLQKLHIQHRELCDFQDLERKVQTSCLLDLESEIEIEKAKSMELQRVVLENHENYIRETYDLQQRVVLMTTNFENLSNENLELKSGASEFDSEKQNLIKAMQEALLEKSAMFSQLENTSLEQQREILSITDILQDACCSLGINVENKSAMCMLDDILQTYVKLNDNQGQLLNLLEDMQNTIKNAEVKALETDHMMESQRVEFVESIKSLKMSIVNELEQERLKREVLNQELVEAQRKLSDAQNQEEILIETFENLNNRHVMIETKYRECMESLKKHTREQPLRDGLVTIEPAKLEKIVKRTMHLETLVRKMNIDSAILSKEKEELSLRLDMILMKRDPDSDVLVDYNRAKTALFNLEERVTAQTLEIQKLSNEKQECMRLLTGYQQDSLERFTKLSDLYDRSQAAVDWMNHVISRVRPILERYAKEPECHEVLSLLQK